MIWFLFIEYTSAVLTDTPMVYQWHKDHKDLVWIMFMPIVLAWNRTVCSVGTTPTILTIQSVIAQWSGFAVSGGANERSFTPTFSPITFVQIDNFWSKPAFDMSRFSAMPGFQPGCLVSRSFATDHTVRQCLKLLYFFGIADGVSYTPNFTMAN